MAIFAPLPGHWGGLLLVLSWLIGKVATGKSSRVKSRVTVYLCSPPICHSCNTVCCHAIELRTGLARSGSVNSTSCTAWKSRMADCSGASSPRLFRWKGCKSFICCLLFTFAKQVTYSSVLFFHLSAAWLLKTMWINFLGGLGFGIVNNYSILKIWIQLLSSLTCLYYVN